MKTNLVLIKRGQYLEFLDCFGPTEEEIEWTQVRKNALKMPREDAERRLATVKKFSPLAEIVEA